jgi:alpha-glucosidase
MRSVESHRHGWSEDRFLRWRSAFELALSVLFTSSIQHYAEIPEGMAKAPDYVRDFLKGVPSIWDEVRFLAGDSGKYVVIARRSGKKWYIGGVNADRTSRELVLDLPPLGPLQSATLISDGGQGNLSFERTSLDVTKDSLKVEMQGHGGLVVEVWQR